MSDNKILLLFYFLTIAGFILSSEANSYLNYPSFPARENGTCYTRVPYSDALALNATRGFIEIVPGSEQEGVKSSRVRGWVTVVSCCNGFLRNNDTGKCETHCDGGCVGGTCTGPNICTCEDGWQLVGDECKPVCRRRCQEHAYCFAPEVCDCEFGYEDAGDGVCRPVCLHDCRNGDCVAPRECRCHPGFFLNETKHCEPQCEGGCPHGICERPGVCACNEGYVHPPNTRESCEAYCPDTCKNGICYSPGICTCNEGYTRDASGSCVPECKNGCDNGKCVAPELCQCDSGFRLDDQSKNCIKLNTKGSENNLYYEDFQSNDKTRNQHYIHRNIGQHDIYVPRQLEIPKRVIGLNETNQSQSTYINNEPHRSSQSYDSQGTFTSQRYNPSQVPYNTQKSNQMQNSHEVGGSYRMYENSYGQGQEHIDTENSQVIQIPRQNVYENREPYRHYDTSQTHEPQRTISIHEISQTHEPQRTINIHEISQTHEPQRTINVHDVSQTHEPQRTINVHDISQTHESQRTINVHQISQTHEPQRTINGHEITQIPEAHIIITPYNVLRNNRPYEPIQTFSQQSDLRENQDLRRTNHHYQSQATQTDFDSDYTDPKLTQFTDYTRENITFNVDELNRTESIASLNHQGSIHNNPTLCDDSESDDSEEDEESNWYDQNSYERQHYLPIKNETKNTTNINRPVPDNKNNGPLCVPACTNSQCTGPNQCTCKPGYRLEPKFMMGLVCVPICPGGCLNGICSGPNLCICSAGFVKEHGLKDSNKCVPVTYY